MPLPDDDLHDFEKRVQTFDDIARDVFVIGSDGPAVVVMPEMPGISPEVARFARWVRDAGFTVYVPSLFGTPGIGASAEEGSIVMKRACVSAEFRVFAGGGTSPIVNWLRQLAREAHTERGGPGVGVIGMCFTGNFALTMALEPSVIAPVLSQPSLPLDDPAGLEISAEDAETLKQRFASDGLKAMGLRFDNDRWCTAERFDSYKQLLGDGFCPRVLAGSSANPNPSEFHAKVVVSPHSVLTAHLVDEDGHPTIQARDAVLAFLGERLGLHASTVE